MRKHYQRWTPETAPQPTGLNHPSPPVALVPVPLQFASCVLWLTGDSLHISNGGSVTTWYDISGNGNHLTTKSATKPLTADGAKNGHVAVATLSGSSEWLQGPVVNWSQPNHYFLVCQNDNDPTNSFMVDGTTNRNAIFMQGSGGFYTYFAGTSQLTSVHDTTGSYNYHSVLFNGASSHYRINGSTVSSANPGAAAMDQVRLSCDSSAGFFMSNHFLELIVYNAALVAADEAKIEAYIKAKYGL